MLPFIYSIFFVVLIGHFSIRDKDELVFSFFNHNQKNKRMNNLLTEEWKVVMDYLPVGKKRNNKASLVLVNRSSRDAIWIVVRPRIQLIQKVMSHLQQVYDYMSGHPLPENTNLTISHACYNQLFQTLSTDFFHINWEWLYTQWKVLFWFAFYEPHWKVPLFHLETYRSLLQETFQYPTPDQMDGIRQGYTLLCWYIKCHNEIDMVCESDSPLQEPFYLFRCSSVVMCDIELHRVMLR